MNLTNLGANDSFLPGLIAPPSTAPPNAKPPIGLRNAIDTPQGSVDDPLASELYPLQYVEQAELKDGTPVLLRPIRLEDEPLMIRFHESLSDETVWRRYFQLLHLRERIDHDRLTRICLNDFDREVALVAEHRSADGEREILGVGRLSRGNGASTAEFSVLISDAWQGRGLGHLLLEKVIHVGYKEGIHRIVGCIMPDNWAMQVCCQSLGFCLKHSCDGVDARLDLHRN